MNRTCCGVKWHCGIFGIILWPYLQYIAQNIWSLDPLLLTLKVSLLMKLITIEVASLFVGFLSGVTVDFVLLGCDSTSLGYRLPMLQDAVVVWQCQQPIAQWHSASCKNTTANKTDVTWALQQDSNLFWYAVRALPIAFQVLKGTASIDRYVVTFMVHRSSVVACGRLLVVYELTVIRHAQEVVNVTWAGFTALLGMMVNRTVDVHSVTSPFTDCLRGVLILKLFCMLCYGITTCILWDSLVLACHRLLFWRFCDLNNRFEAFQSFKVIENIV